MANNENDGCLETFGGVIIFGIVINVLTYFWKICVAVWTAVGNFISGVVGFIGGVLQAIGAFFGAVWGFLVSVDWFFLGSIVVTAVIVYLIASYINRSVRMKSLERKMRRERQEYWESPVGKAHQGKIKLDDMLKRVNGKVSTVTNEINEHTKFYNTRYQELKAVKNIERRNQFAPMMQTTYKKIAALETHRSNLLNTKDELIDELKVQAIKMKAIGFYESKNSLSNETANIEKLLRKADDLLEYRYNFDTIDVQGEEAFDLDWFEKHKAESKVLYKRLDDFKSEVRVDITQPIFLNKDFR